GVPDLLVAFRILEGWTSGWARTASPFWLAAGSNLTTHPALYSVVIFRPGSVLADELDHLPHALGFCFVVFFFINRRWQRTDQLFLLVGKEESLVGGNKISTGRQVACCGNLPFYKCVIKVQNSSHVMSPMCYVFISLLLDLEVRRRWSVTLRPTGI